MSGVRAILVALAVVACACSSPAGPSEQVPTPPTPPIQEYTVVPIFNGLGVVLNTPGSWGGWTIRSAKAAPLTAGDVKVTTHLVGGEPPRYYLFPHLAEEVNAVNWVKCFKLPFDCSAAIAGPITGLNEIEVLVGHISGLSTATSFDLMFANPSAAFVGSIDIKLVAPK